SFVVADGTHFKMTGVGGTFDGNFNSIPGQGVQKLFVAIVSLGSGDAVPSFAPGDIAANTIASFAFAPPAAAGDFTVSVPNLLLDAGAYAAIFGADGLLGSGLAGETGLADGNLTVDTPNVFSNFGGDDATAWSAYGFDTGIRI